MKLPTVAVAVLIAVSFPTALPAVAATPAVASPQDNEAALRTWLADNARWATPYIELVTSRTAQIDTVMDGAERILQLVETGKTDEARQWVATWEAEQRAALTALDARFAELPVEPPPAPSAFRGQADASAIVRGNVELRDRVGTFLRQSTAVNLRTLESFGPAASGTPEGLTGLSNGLFDLMMTMLESENLMLANSRPPAPHVNFYLSESWIASNNAAGAWMTHVRNVSHDEGVDRDAAAATIRRHAAAAAEAATELKARGAQLRLEFEASPEAATPLGRSMMVMFDNIDQSADVELQMAAQYDRLADAVASGDMQAGQSIADGLAQYVERRMGLQQEKRAFMANL